MGPKHNLVHLKSLLGCLLIKSWTSSRHLHARKKIRLIPSLPSLLVIHFTLVKWFRFGWQDWCGRSGISLMTLISEIAYHQFFFFFFSNSQTPLGHFDINYKENYKRRRWLFIYISWYNDVLCQQLLTPNPANLHFSVDQGSQAGHIGKFNTYRSRQALTFLRLNFFPHSSSWQGINIPQSELLVCPRDLCSSPPRVSGDWFWGLA